MPEFTHLVAAVSALAILGEATAAFLLWRNGYIGRWNSLFCLLTYRAVSESAIALFILPIHDLDMRAEAYFYAFWIVKIGEIVMQFWVLWSIVSKLLPRSFHVQRIGLAAFLAITASALTASAVCASHSSTIFYLRVTKFAYRAESAATLAWCIAFLLITFLSGLVGIIWRTEKLVVTSGFALHIALRTLAVWVASRAPYSADPVLNASDIGFLLSLSLWIFYFRSRRYEPDVNRELADEIRHELQSLRATNN